MITVEELMEALEGLPGWWPVEVGLEYWSDELGERFEYLEPEGPFVCRSPSGLGDVELICRFGFS